MIIDTEMVMRRFVTILMLISLFLMAGAKKKGRTYPLSEIKVSYNYHKKFVRGSDGVVEQNIPFILLAGRNQSKFYCPSTEYRDSLLSTPAGRAKEREMFDAAAAAYVMGRDRSAMDAVVYHSRLYVTKDYETSLTTLYDEAGMGEGGYYEEPFSEFECEIVADSTKMVLDYSCVMATADYHGRRWTLWFAPDIPLQDGPWKCCGLPGLILEASDMSGQHSFTATGIQHCAQPISPVISTYYAKMPRKEMLRATRHYRQHSNAMFKSATGMDLGTAVDAPPTVESLKYDLLETDYHE